MEVHAVCGLTVKTAVSRCTVKNAISSRIDLADLSKCIPSGKYAISTRARVNFGVRRHFPGIVDFSENAPCFSLPFAGNDGFGVFQK